MSLGLQRLAELVRLYREASLLSQSDLARRVSPRTSRSAIAHLEQGLRLPNARTLRAICSYLRIPEALWLPLEVFGTKDGRGAEAGPSFLALSGPMGSGKTTLGKRLASALGMTYLAESSQGISFLPDLERNRQRWAFDTQMAFLAQKATSIVASLERGLRILVDRSLYEDISIFAKYFEDSGDIDRRSLSVYYELANYFKNQIPTPDALIYCRCRFETVVDRVRERQRADTVLHTERYVAEIYSRYEEWISAYSDTPILVVDSDAVDFRDPLVVQRIAGEECRAVFATTLSGWPSGSNPGIVEFTWKYATNPGPSPQTLILAYPSQSAYHLTIQCDIYWGTTVGNIIVFGPDPPPPTDPTTGSVKVDFTWTDAPDPVGPDDCQQKTLLLCNEVPNTCPLTKTDVAGNRSGTSCIYTHTFLGVSPATFPHLSGGGEGNGWVKGSAITSNQHSSLMATKIVPGQLVTTQPFSGN